jgi:hypothetical protein
MILPGITHVFVQVLSVFCNEVNITIESPCVFLEWLANPVNDMYADAALAAVLQAEANPIPTASTFFSVLSFLKITKILFSKNDHWIKSLNSRPSFCNLKFSNLQNCRPYRTLNRRQVCAARRTFRRICPLCRWLRPPPPWRRQL